MSLKDWIDLDGKTYVINIGGSTTFYLMANPSAYRYNYEVGVYGESETDLETIEGFRAESLEEAIGKAEVIIKEYFELGLSEITSIINWDSEKN